MSSILPAEVMQQSAYTWLPRIKVKSQIIYTTVLGAIVLALIAAIFIRVDVSVNVPGIIRPITEKTELRSLTTGSIAKVLVKEGQTVQQGQPLLLMQQDITTSKLNQASYELNKRQSYISDLQLLASGAGHRVRSGQYRQQYLLHQASLSEQRATLDKLRSDLTMFTKLYEEKVIAKKEFIEKKYAYEQAKANYQARVAEQNARWQQELEQARVEAQQYSSGKDQLQREKDLLEIKAPVSGTVQQFNGRYAGGSVQTGELLGFISPDSGMIGETFVSPADIGYIYQDMPVKFQVDAFNYNSWGTLNGKVISIDNDFSIVNDQPFFKVRCALHNTTLTLNNGVEGKLKKGMTLQCRFILARRGLLQLLYERTDSWINPNAKHGKEMPVQ
jgi:membrane fusion protein, peptide pheromone/bacteriocin exporter